MSKDWESIFVQWAKSPSKTEREKMANAEAAIEKAIDSSESLSTKSLRVFPQGSYRNRTNIREDSDVDICVLCSNTFYFELPDGCTREDFGLNSPAKYGDADYRKDIHDALISHFGTDNVASGNKAWDIHENTYRLDADVVACFAYRYYFTNGTFRTGAAVLPQSGPYIVNYPDQNYENGRMKNDLTARRFRGVVRILKYLNAEIIEADKDFKGLPSFLIESLVWNVPNEGFNHDDYRSDIQWVLAHLCNETRENGSWSSWCEVNGYKYLFHSSQKWSRSEVNAALNKFWYFIGFD